MGRTTVATDANKQYGDQSKAAYAAAQGDIGTYRGNLAKLESGRNVGADPFKQTGYLSNVNKLQSEALNTASGASKAELARRLKATGGLNASQTVAGIKDVGLETGRLADTLSAERAANDYKANLQWQQYLAGAPLAAAGAEGNLYGTATGGQSAALKAYTDLQNARYGFWGNIIGSAFQGAGTGAGLAAGCWIAEAIYGEDDPRTHLLRSWLNQEFKERWYGRMVMSVYLRFGQRIAAGIRKFSPLGWVFRPWFELALMSARRDRQRLVEVF